MSKKGSKMSKAAKRTLTAMLVLVGGALALSAGLAVASEPGDLADASAVDYALAQSPIDARDAIDQGWPATADAIRERALMWWRDNRVATESDETLADVIASLSSAISSPPVDTQPDRVMYVAEMIYRREAACRSLSPDNPLRDDYCSATSAPDLVGVPWATT